MDFKIWETFETQETVIKYQPGMFDYIANNNKIHPKIEEKYPEFVASYKYNL